MKQIINLGMLFLVTLLIADPVLSQDLFIYPNKGQSKEQMDKDKYECYGWAKEQTGFDPATAPQSAVPAPQKEPERGGLLRGAAKGAAVGAVGGAIAGDAGKGAAIGATTGGLLGGMKRRRESKKQQEAAEQQAQNQAASYEQQRSEYNRAFGACLEGRGYTVK